MSLASRGDIPNARRVVVKVGSSSISGEEGQARIPKLVAALADAYGRGCEIVLVSSGAIATGLPLLTLNARPNDLATQQAAAAVGQNMLVYRYQEALRPFNIVAGQVLLTAHDLEDDTARSNARRAMARLLGLGVLPIVNENDTVATHEIRFGDNDRLAALVAQLIGADVLILLSDIDSLYTKPPTEPDAEPIVDVEYGASLSGAQFGSVVVNSVGTGGAVTKVSAARLAAASGIAVLITCADRVLEALNGADGGTWFAPNPDAARFTGTGAIKTSLQ